MSFSVIILLLSCVSFASAYSGGSGTAADPYLISSAADLNALGTDFNNWDKSFKLTADVNMSAYTGMQYKIIGNANKQFTGSFDGDGHVIRSLTYANTNPVNYVGLFGYTSNAAIKNLGLEDVNISSAGNRTGALAGQQDSGTIISCYSTGKIVSTTASSYAYTGGLVGYQNGGAITSCRSSCSVNSTANSTATDGGLVGWQFAGSITSSYSTGNIASTSSNATAYAGGLVGASNYGSPITSSYSTGNTVSTSNAPSYFSAPAYAGGLAAGCAGNNNIVNCYSTGQVSAYGNYLVYKGGLIGIQNGTPTTACFWDVNTSGLNTSAGGTGKTTAEMKTLSTFTSAGWDFTNETANDINDYWRMCVNGINYPHLNWQSIDGDLACPDGVNFIDFADFAARWLTAGCSSSNNFCGGADINFSGIVDMTDFAMFADNWLEGI